MSTERLNQDQLEEENLPNVLHGVLVSYVDDQINECVNTALRRKSRVRYKCMDTFSNLLAFGTSGGAVYLFKLKSLSHSSCILSSMVPCDQGSIEVIKFLPSPRTDDLLIALGTSRGSLVIFKLSQVPGDDNPVCTELYKAESFTNNRAIKLIECDQNLLDLRSQFTKLFICDSANRLYILDSSSIYGNKQTLRLFYSSNIPSLIFSINDSKINQISVRGTQLIISTDETTRMFNELTNELKIIGKKKRKDGFYGACFFDPNYRPTRILQLGSVRQDSQTAYSSTASLNESENLLIFVARPMFRLWHVSHRGEVKFTHQFEHLIRSNRFDQSIDLHNSPLNEDIEDYPPEIIDKFTQRYQKDNNYPELQIKSDHFQKLLQIYSSTLGNLLLSYTRHELFVVDPIQATLIILYHQEAPIIQVCSNENELFIWSMESEGEERHFRVKRFVLLAPTQFVLELHRLHRYASLIMFVQLFTELFRVKMALPLSGIGVITTEGGLLRNVLLNAWDIFTSRVIDDNNEEIEDLCLDFKRIVEDIMKESREMKRSVEEIANSRFFLTMTNENIDRICTEPYASLISLDVSIKDLHTKHVIHFNQDAMNRHKSVANLSQNVEKLTSNKYKAIQSNSDLSSQKQVFDVKKNHNKSLQEMNRLEVIVERRKNVKINRLTTRKSETVIGESEVSAIKEVSEVLPSFKDESAAVPILEDESGDKSLDDLNEDSNQTTRKCNHCHWPRPRSHLKPMSSDQRKQLQWIDENLMSNFEENIMKIEELTFKHGLWVMFLRCLAFRNQTDDYISCCMLLDDIRLLDIEQFVIIHGGEVEIFNRLLTHVSRKTELLDRLKIDNKSPAKVICLKCGGELELPLDTNKEVIDNLAQIIDKTDAQSDEFCFNLLNLFELFMARRNANLKKLISTLLKHTKLINNTRISPTFYMKVIATATFKANLSPLSQARFKAITS